MSQEQATYPIVIKGELDESLSQGLWLVKWFLAIPHYIILAFLSVGFVIAWIIALFVILFTGKYPRSLFDFNVGVLRWSWRVGFYSYLALATDKYPPFTLKSSDYPADLDVVYPEKLSQGLVLVKWWLLAIPHFLVVSFFMGSSSDSWFVVGPRYGGLVTLLAVISAVFVLFKRPYPKEIFEFIMGMNRWSYRVFAYVALMTDEYPPFRIKD
ncbi:DUF4389 domain-containing protein [Chloroflexota bacterium]